MVGGGAQGEAENGAKEMSVFLRGRIYRSTLLAIRNALRKPPYKRNGIQQAIPLHCTRQFNQMWRLSKFAQVGGLHSEKYPQRRRLKTQHDPVRKYQRVLKQISPEKKLNQLLRPPEPRSGLNKLIALKRCDQLCRALWRIVQPSAHFFYRG